MRTGRVYKIISNTGDEVYVGSTFQKRLWDRFRSHKQAFGYYKEGKKSKGGFTTSFELFEKYGVDGCKIVLVKEYEVVDRKHLLACELLWINKLKCVNRRVPFNPALYCIHFKKNGRRKWRGNCYNCANNIRERRKQYYDNNKEKILGGSKQYYDNNKQKKKQYYENNKEKILGGSKQYYEDNKDVILGKSKQYYENNKEKRKEKIKCEVCNCEVRKDSFKRHERSKKHITNLNK
jgi:hypothetical protein